MDMKVFFDDVRHSVFGGSLSQDQVDGLTMTLRKCAEHAVVDRDAVANVLGQICHETGRTMRPVRETFATSDAQAASRLEAAFKAGKLSWVKTPYWRADAKGQHWFGRGPIQTTHRENYAKIDTALGLNGALLLDPGLMLNAEIGFDAAVVGMRDGLYTGKELGDYFGPGDDPDSAHGEGRRIVNGVESRAKVQALAVAFERALAKAEASAPVAIPVPAREDAPSPSVPAPAPVGHNGGPAMTPEPATHVVTPIAQGLSPIEQMNKPVQGAYTGTGGATIGGALVLLMQSAGWMPDAWSEPVPAAALGLVAGWLFTTIGSFIGSYRARDKRFQAQVAS